jgi:hypothetical protein
MDIETRCAKLFAACGGAASALWLRPKHYNEKQALSADLNEWENEGGNLAPSPAVPDIPLTSGSA